MFRVMLRNLSVLLMSVFQILHPFFYPLTVPSRIMVPLCVDSGAIHAHTGIGSIPEFSLPSVRGCNVKQSKCRWWYGARVSTPAAGAREREHHYTTKTCKKIIRNAILPNFPHFMPVENGANVILEIYVRGVTWPYTPQWPLYNHGLDGREISNHAVSIF